MTTEDRNITIDYLKEMQEGYIEGEGYERHPLPEWYALDKAIKALALMPCEDCISRQAAIDAVMDLCKHYTPTKSVNHPHMDFVIEVLQDLPSVTPKEKAAEWYEENGCKGS